MEESATTCGKVATVYGSFATTYGKRNDLWNKVATTYGIFLERKLIENTKKAQPLMEALQPSQSPFLFPI